MLQNVRLRHRTIVISIIVVCLVWAAVYTYQAASDPFGGDEAALFIQPLFFLLLIIAIWSAIEAVVSSHGAGGSTPADALSGTLSSERKQSFGASGLADRRRLTVILSLPLMVMLTWLIGFIVSSVAFVAGLAWMIGERRVITLAGLALAAIAVVWLFFSKSLGVPLPLWPRWLG